MLQITLENTNNGKNRATSVVLEWDKPWTSHESVYSNQMLSVYEEQRVHRLPMYLYTVFPSGLIRVIRVGRVECSPNMSLAPFHQGVFLLQSSKFWNDLAKFGAKDRQTSKVSNSELPSVVSFMRLCQLSLSAQVEVFQTLCFIFIDYKIQSLASISFLESYKITCTTDWSNSWKYWKIGPLTYRWLCIENKQKSWKSWAAFPVKNFKRKSGQS